MTAHFARLLEICLPNGGVVLTLIEGYFDESITNGVTAVAGLLLTEDHCRALETEWNAVLGRWELPYFRMVECEHRKGAFQHLEAEDRERAKYEFIEIIRKFSLLRIEAECWPETKTAWTLEARPGRPVKLVTPYMACSYACFNIAANFVVRYMPGASLACLFEAGHEDEAEAKLVLERLTAIDDLREHFQNVSFTFIPKKLAVPLQCADLIAWQTIRSSRRIVNDEGGASRKDWNYLVDRKEAEMCIVDLFTAIEITGLLTQLSGFGEMGWGKYSPAPRRSRIINRSWS